MRTTRATTRVLAHLAVAAAAVALTAGPAAAETATPNPDIRSFPGGLSCSGDVVTGKVRVTSTTGTEYPGRVELRHNTGGKAYTATSLVHSFTVKGKGMRDYYFTFDISGVPVGTKNLLAYAVVGPTATPIDTAQSKVLPTTACAPAAVVPEAPVAALIPLTLAATAGAVAVARRRREGAPVPA